MQVLNVALGGTLHQHLPEVIGHTGHQQGNAVFSTEVRTVAGSRLAGLIGDSSQAQCYHHQAIDRLGDGLVISARDSDGVVEAGRDAGEHFVVGVQWHPEETPTICGCSPVWWRRASTQRRGRICDRQHG